MEQTGEAILDLPSLSFRPKVFGLGAWTDNLAFAYDLAATLRPKVLVELGTDRGESYFAFCQSILENNTDTRAFAVDTWEGDEQAGVYDETTYEEVSTYNQRYYDRFSTLLRMTFDRALASFAPGTINLLHLDGLHTEAAVRHDLANWLPKLERGGILLMHDVCVRRDSFGVWKVWEELCREGRAYTFANGPGLGVWQKPPGRLLDSPLEELLDDKLNAREKLGSYYRERAQDLQKMIALAWRDESIRHTAIAHQTIIQLFHSHDGNHTEGNSVVARVGHAEWKDLTLHLPAGAGLAPLRLDFLSALTVIDLSVVKITSGTEVLFDGVNLKVEGDAIRLPHPDYLRLQVTGIDPQLYFPVFAHSSNAPVSLHLRMRVSPA